MPWDNLSQPEAGVADYAPARMHQATWRVFVSGVFLGGCLGALACGTPPAASETDAGTALPDAGTDTGQEDPPSCSVPASITCPDPAPHYADVAPIFNQQCGTCHNDSPGAPWSLMNYGHVSDWQDTIWADLRDCSMPPPDGGVTLTPEERLAILTWIRCGLPK